jgi:uncharacterized protein (TIGR03086 family)
MDAQQIDLEPAARRLADLVRAVPDDALCWPTPCAAYTVADLLDHVAGLLVAFRAAARKEPLDAGPAGDGSRLVGGWRTRLPADAEALVEAWRDPGAWAGTTGAGGVELPGEVAGVVALDEVVLHGWDLAKAIDRPAGYDGPGLAAVFAVVGHFRSLGVDGLFGPEVAVPRGAPLFDRTLGLSGRDPAWRSPRAARVQVIA